MSSLGVIGTILTAADLLRLSIDPGLLLFPSAIVVAGNVLYREVQRRRQAEGERDAARAALNARPDEAAIVRMFLALHDEGARVLEPFHDVVEKLPISMPIGEERYADRVDRCTAAIEAYRPAYALRFRESLIASSDRAYRGMIVVVKDDDGKDRHVEMGTVRKYDDLVGQSMTVLAGIVAAGSTGSRSTQSNATVGR